MYHIEDLTKVEMLFAVCDGNWIKMLLCKLWKKMFNFHQNSQIYDEINTSCMC